MICKHASRNMKKLKLAGNKKLVSYIWIINTNRYSIFWIPSIIMIKFLGKNYRLKFALFFLHFLIIEKVDISKMAICIGPKFMNFIGCF